jgi:hypothetical protein
MVPVLSAGVSILPHYVQTIYIETNGNGLGSGACTDCIPEFCTYCVHLVFGNKSVEMNEMNE